MLIFNVEETIARIQSLADKKGVSLNHALSQCGFKDFVVNLRKGSKPSIDKFFTIANYFDVSLDYLLVGNESSNNHLNKDTTEIELINNFKNLDREEKIMLLERSRTLVDLKHLSEKEKKSVSVPARQQPSNNAPPDTPEYNYDDSINTFEVRVYEPADSSKTVKPINNEQESKKITVPLPIVSKKANPNAPKRGVGEMMENIDGVPVYLAGRGTGKEQSSTISKEEHDEIKELLASMKSDPIMPKKRP